MTTTTVDLTSDDENMVSFFTVLPLLLFFSSKLIFLLKLDAVEWFADPFDILDDDEEYAPDANEDPESILDEYNQEFDFDPTNLDEEEMVIDEATINKQDDFDQVKNNSILKLFILP